MATTPKKTSAVKKTTAKKTTKKAAPARKTISKKQELCSFRVASEPQPFMTFKLTQQTVYWVVIAVISVALASWILVVQKDINSLYDEIRRIQTSDTDMSAEIIQPNKDTAQTVTAQ